jgi:hypothetical protein
VTTIRPVMLPPRVTVGLEACEKVYAPTERRSRPRK